MARSLSRSRKTASKSPARLKRQVTPKSEPKKKTTPKSEPRKKSSSKTYSRSRSASRGHNTKKIHKHAVKNVGLSKSHSRELAGLAIEMSTTKISPKHSERQRVHSPPTRHADLKKTLPSKTPSMKAEASKTPSMKTSTSKPSSNKSTIKTILTSSMERASRPSERKLFTSASMEPGIRQRFLRHESSSRPPTQVKVKRPVVSFCSSMYSRVCGTVCAAGRCICSNTRAFCNMIIVNRREIFVTILLLLLVALITYFILYTDPAKTRAFIQSIPGNVHAWYLKNFGRK